MKRVYLLINVAIIALCVASCSSKDEGFDQTLLYGKWVNNAKSTEYWRYDSNGMGATWDTSEDVSEAEAQDFQWTLIKSDLTHIHIMSAGSGNVPKSYTVTVLTNGTLSYKDYTNKVFSFTKVK